MGRSKGWKKVYVRWRNIRKYIDLKKSCLTDKEQNQVMDMLYKYKEAFSLRDMCPYIEVEIDMTDKSPFL